MALGEGGMFLLPARPGVCQECGVDHDPKQPHNQQSIYYQYRFYSLEGRWPTWRDALKHCTPRVRLYWETELRARGVEVPNHDEPPEVLPVGENVVGSVQHVSKAEVRRQRRAAKKKKKGEDRA